MKFRIGEKIKIFPETDRESYARMIHDEGYRCTVHRNCIVIEGRLKEQIDDVEFGRRLRMARKAKGIKRKDMSAIMKVAESSIFEWEVGRRHPKDKNLKLFCKLVDLDPQELKESCRIKE